MPDNPFLLLELAPSLALDPQLLEQRYREASKSLHPDSPGGETAAFTALGAARSTLARLSTRIPAALDALGCPPESPAGSASGNRSVAMSSELVTLFAELEPAIQEVTAVARRKAAARSELGRALLAREELAARRRLEEAGQKIDAQIRARSDQLSELDQLLPSSPGTTAREARRIAGDCAFLEKWQDQVRATLAQLFT